MSKTALFSNSIGRKLLMGLTGIFLITFLIVHVAVNSLIFFNDGGETFNWGAHFMGHNWLIRSMEIVLFAGILAHIFLALWLTIKNKKARPIDYATKARNANSKWYSRWMGLLGTLILMFLIIHIRHFWVETRVTGLEEYYMDKPGMSAEDLNNHENLFGVMKIVFSELWVVVLYCVAMVSLAYHLLHGFQSSFQTLGLNHKKYTPIIKKTGIAFSIIVPLLFAAMPISMYMGWIK